VGAETFPVTNGEWYIVVGHADPGAIMSRVVDPLTGMVLAATNTSSPIIFGTIPVTNYIGGTYSGGGFRYAFGGDMAEVLLYTGALSQSDFDSVESYLWTKYFPPALSARQNGANVEINFTGVLQSSTNPGTGYTDVSGSPTSPYVITPAMRASQPVLYFRARNP